MEIYEDKHIKCVKKRADVSTKTCQIKKPWMTVTPVDKNFSDKELVVMFLKMQENTLQQ